MKQIIIILLCLSIIGCSTLSTIQTRPDGAKVFINGEPKGESTAQVELSDLVFNNYSIRIEKEGYQTLYSSLSKEFKIGPFLVGLLLFWPALLWCYGPKSSYHFYLEPTEKRE